MRAVVQRVKRALVRVDGTTISQIGSGFLILLGVGLADDTSDCRYLAEKIANLRVFPDQEGKMNISALDANAEMLAVSQFTLYGDCRKGRRPSFTDAAGPDRGRELYDLFCRHLEEMGFRVGRGEFGAHMEVELVNDGPVTLLLDSKGDF